MNRCFNFTLVNETILLISDGEKLTCYDNSELKDGKPVKEEECKVNQLQCVTIASNNIKKSKASNPLLERGCNTKGTVHNITVPSNFDYCVLQKSKEEEVCSCYCHNHMCNNFGSKCKDDVDAFVIKSKDIETRLTPTLDTDPEKFLAYLQKKYSFGFVEEITTPKTTPSPFTMASPTTTSSAILSKKMNWILFLASQVMMSSKLNAIN